MKVKMFNLKIVIFIRFSIWNEKQKEKNFYA